MFLKLSFIRRATVVAAAASVLAAPAAAQESGAAAGPGVPSAAVPDSVPDSLPTYASADGHVYLTRDEALVEIYPGAGRVRAERWSLSRRQVERIEDRSRVEVPDRSPVILRVTGGDGGLRGYAMILEERGKYRPITMMVGVAPDFTVRGVEVMVYREDRGEEVRYDRFLRQYRDKGTGDPIRTHRDIMNVTGATISVHSMNDGVRRALHTVETLYGGGATAARRARTDGDGPVVLGRWRPGTSR